MACAIVATVGGASSNSYATAAQADTYHEAHVSGATWTAATDDQKCRALVQATRQLDAYVEWDGYAASTTQALAWPRTGLYDPNTEVDLPSDALPDELVWATAEQARHLLAGDRAAESTAEVQGVTRIAAGSVELEFAPTSGTRQSVLAPAAYQFIAQWGTQRQRGRGGPVALERA